MDEPILTIWGSVAAVLPSGLRHCETPGCPTVAEWELRTVHRTGADGERRPLLNRPVSHCGACAAELQQRCEQQGWVAEFVPLPEGIEAVTGGVR